VGRTQSHESVSVKIPKGVDDGTRIRLSSKGEAGIKGGGNGDLYIFVSAFVFSLLLDELLALNQFLFFLRFHKNFF